MPQHSQLEEDLKTIRDCLRSIMHEMEHCVCPENHDEGEQLCNEILEILSELEREWAEDQEEKESLQQRSEELRQQIMEARLRISQASSDSFSS